ncbi:MAG: hypothetical protein RLZZ176_2271 [Cyanobacteriota bacterium]|jgi:hypothetical protein
MSSGGYREGSGRKSSWASGCSKDKTKLIRVPVAIADRVLEVAHKIDAGQAPDGGLNLEDLIYKARAIIYNPDLVRSKDRSVARRYFSELLGCSKECLK